MAERKSILTSREYWTSPDDRFADADHGNEFPLGASEPPSELSRRGMLGLMGASAALAGLAGCRRPVETIVPFAKAPEDRVPGVPRHYATAMPLGTSAYGLLVESHEGRPTKIEGNRLHPTSRGAASAWMQAAILDLYDPDRVASVGHREGGEFRSATWSDLEALLDERRTVHLADDGKGLAVLSEGYSSPTLARLVSQFIATFPGARWVVHEPVGDENIFEGVRLAARQALRPVYHLDRAKVVVALDADLLLTDSDSVAQARGFAAGRSPDAMMSRLWAVESALSVTGAAADHRLRVTRTEMPVIAAALAGELASLGVPIPTPSASSRPSPEAMTAIRAMASDLAAAGTGGLVTAGRAQPPAVHALAQAVNRALGGPVTFYPLIDVGFASPGRLADLVAAMRRGEISTLIVLGGNPVYEAPADLDFVTALAEVPHTLHLTERPNETTAACSWRLPRAHFLESWGDVRGPDGTASVVQPLIAPLLGGRSDVEVTARLVSGAESSGYETVRETWRSLLTTTDFEPIWRRVLHDGLAPGTALSEVAFEVDAGRILAAWTHLPAPPEADLEVTFHPSASVFDGRFANNGWLQELPDPVTKITWDNAALVSPATAEELGVESGQVLRLKLGERQVEAPAWISPGQADRSIALSLGYGRTNAGRVADGVGYDAYLLRRMPAPWAATGLTIEATEKRHQLVQTQEHWRMEGRHLVREATLDEYRAHPGFASEPEAHFDPVELWPQHEYDEGYQWGMAIDLNACIGCNACVVACQSENNIPIVGRDQVARGREMHWLRIDRYFTGELDDPEVVYQPVTCQHCENAPCEQVCPVAATVHDAEGLNVMVYNRCIGTRYCSNNCPYKVRRFNFYNFTKDTPELVKLAMNPDVTVRSRGVMEKCTYCLQRINGAKIAAKQEDRRVGDEDLQTACQQTCPTEAITFGDVNNASSRVTAVKRDERNYLLLAELFNKPRTSYLARIRNPATKSRA